MKRLDPNCQAARDIITGRYRIRTISQSELASVLIPRIWEEGWNPGIHDETTFYHADPQGFMVGELDDEPIATLSAVRYSDQFGFMGCYTVRARFRGQGYGLALHEAGRAHLHGCVQGGDGVLENVKKYEHIGRKFAYRNARYGGVKNTLHWKALASVEGISETFWKHIEEMDAACFPAPRTEFLRQWINQPDSHAVVLPAADGTSAINGFGVIRRCYRGWKIGPLLARESWSAGRIFEALVDRIPYGDEYFLDVPEPNFAAKILAHQHHMRQVFATARMYTGNFPQVRMNWIYGGTTFELG